ncbi:hypothetical protein CBS101457_000312 [Exobasidium rhododendri]|nr:hypothetical protein CBS101457_000312 [Exobasidium rhododendri]
MPSSATGGAVSSRTQKHKQSAMEGGKQAVKALPWVPVVQGQVSTLPTVFTRDADFFFVAASSSVRIYSRITGQLVSTLSSAASTSSRTTWSGRQVTDSHAALITGLSLNPANSLQLLTCSLDGTIKVWDYLDAILLRTIDLGFPISHMIAHDTIKGSVYVVLKKPKNVASQADVVDPFHFNGRCNSIIQLVSLTTLATKGAGATKSQNVTRVGKARQTTCISLSADGKYLVLIGKRKIHIARSDALQEGFNKVISDHELTSLAFHPENNVFATGDSIGQIRLWYFLDDGLDQQKNLKNVDKGVRVAPSVLMHWHSHAVSALTFTPNGANLLSGGEESVVVLWQLATQNREYVPRLGGATIQSITVLQGSQGREEEYVASLADGSIAFIGAINLKANRTISQVLIDSSKQLLGKEYLSQLTSFPLAVQPGTNYLVINAGHPSSLQFFDVEKSRLVSQMEIVPSNRVSRPDDVPLEYSRVEKVCFSAKGEWMATTDSRGRGESSLKVWKWDAKVKAYSLNSRIDQPHKNGKVTSMSFCPSGVSSSSSSSSRQSSSPSPLLLTAGSDKQARTWRKISQDVKGGRKEEFWIARSAFDYRQLPILDSCWEPNGTLLALALDGFVTLWEPASNSLQQVIPITGTCKKVLFAGKGGRYVVALTDRSLLVWDIVTGRVSWEVEVSADQLILDGEQHFSVLSTRAASTTTTTTYSPGRSLPIDEYQVSFAIRQVCGLSSSEAHTRPTATPHFFALTDQFDVVKVGASSSEGEASLQGQLPQSLRGISIKRRTLYDELIGSKEEGDKPVSRAYSAMTAFGEQTNLQVSGGMLEVASHLLPPMSVLYEPMIAQMMPRRRLEEAVEVPKTVEVADGEKEAKEKSEKATAAVKGGVASTGGNSSRMRQVSEMDWSGITALFEAQARISTTSAAATTPAINGKQSNGSGTSKVNGPAHLTTPSKSSPRKAAKVASVQVNGDNVKSTDSPTTQANGRKRKVVE